MHPFKNTEKIFNAKQNNSVTVNKRHPPALKAKVLKKTKAKKKKKTRTVKKKDRRMLNGKDKREIQHFTSWPFCHYFSFSSLSTYSSFFPPPTNLGRG